MDNATERPIWKIEIAESLAPAEVERILAEAHRADSPPGPPPLLRRIDQSEGRTTVFVAAHERMPAALRAAWGSRGKKAELRVSGSTHEEVRAVP